MKGTSQRRPPRLASKIFDWYCSSASVDDLRGDMDELFYLDVERMSVARARIRYWKHALQLITSYALKKRKQKGALSPFSSNTFNASMLKNYFLIATRSLARHKFFTIINVLGLAIGMSIGLLFIAMLSFIWRYDSFHSNKDNIYRVITQTNSENRTREYATASAALADKLHHDQVEGIDEIVRINNTLGGKVTYGAQEISLEGYYVDENFLTVFTFPLVKGNISTALDKPNSILITEKAAAKLFGTEDPFGKIITLENLGDCEITGVLKDHPKYSHMHFEILGSYATVLAQQTKKQPEAALQEWKEFRGSYVYMLLNKETSASTVEQRMNTATQEIFALEPDFKATYSLQALSAIATGPDYWNQIGPAWDYTGLIIFLVLTMLILVPACFNYSNISISRALKRMKEIGLRKVMGGQKEQIFAQFILETVIITFIALGISYYFFTILRQEFLNMLVDGASALELNTTLPMLLGFLGFAMLVGLAAGAVPAIYFSRLNPIEALKSKSTSNRKRFNFRKSLIVLQFALSIGFVMGVVIFSNQYRQTINYDFGFTHANILDVDLQGANPEIFKNEFSKLSSVQSLSMSSHVMGTSSYNSAWILSKDQVDSIEVFQMFADDHYLENLQLELVAGKNFQGNAAANAKAAIVNEEFLRQFKIVNPIDAIGESFVLTDKQEVTVVGVVKNFHYMSLREPIKSFFFRYDPAHFNVANLKVTSSDMFTTLSEMESVWKTFGGEKKFEAQFFDDEIEEAYAFYFSMIKICGFLGFLAISISCLGLLGMVVFTVENRMKEVGVRKVMGASTATITLLLSKDFAKLMVIAAMIATPITYLFFDKVFLAMQQYQMPIGGAEIILSLLLIFTLGLITVVSQTLRAAKANPVDTLRNE